MALDFDKVFSDFCAKGNQGGNIATSVYEILPTLSKKERQTLSIVRFYADTYDIPELHSFVDDYIKISAKNRNLGFLETKSVNNMLKAMSLQELIPQVGVSSAQKVEK